jgi:hypothetical protein
MTTVVYFGAVNLAPSFQFPLLLNLNLMMKMHIPTRFHSNFLYKISETKVNYVQNKFYQLSSAIILPSDQILKGPKPTLVNLLATSTILQKTKTDLIEFPTNESPEYGYTINQLSNSIGDKVNSSSFHSKSGLIIRFDIQLNPNAIYFEEIYKSTLLNFISQVASLTSAIIAIFAIFLSKSEMFVYYFSKILPKKFLLKFKKNNNLDQDENISKNNSQTQDIENNDINNNDIENNDINNNENNDYNNDLELNNINENNNLELNNENNNLEMEGNKEIDNEIKIIDNENNHENKVIEINEE